jgi:hypothetical protein
MTPEDHVLSSKTCYFAHLDELVNHVNIRIVVKDHSQALCVRRHYFMARVERPNPVLELTAVFLLVTG